jgi:DNA-binding protein HU-beta
MRRNLGHEPVAEDGSAAEKRRHHLEQSVREWAGLILRRVASVAVRIASFNTARAATGCEGDPLSTDRSVGLPSSRGPAVTISLHRSDPAAAFVPRAVFKGDPNMPSPLSKSALIDSITKLQTDDTSKRQVKSIVEALVTIGHKELKKSGVFLVPGFAKFVVVKKPATKARKGINPFTKEPTVFKAKPARKVVKARPVKAVKDAIA